MFEHEITKYYDEIFQFCYHHVRSRQIAEDLCHDTFIRFMEKNSSHMFIRNKRSYLYTIAKNICIDYHRKMKPEYIATIHEELDERSESEYRVIEMQEMISHLDEELREIIILRYFQDLKFKEIAEIMGITVSKAKYLVGKAIGELQKEEPALESKRRGGKLNE